MREEYDFCNTTGTSDGKLTQLAQYLPHTAQEVEAEMGRK